MFMVIHIYGTCVCLWFMDHKKLFLYRYVWNKCNQFNLMCMFMFNVYGSFVHLLFMYMYVVHVYVYGKCVCIWNMCMFMVHVYVYCSYVERRPTVVQHHYHVVFLAASSRSPLSERSLQAGRWTQLQASRSAIWWKWKGTQRETAWLKTMLHQYYVKSIKSGRTQSVDFRSLRINLLLFIVIYYCLLLFLIKHKKKIWCGTQT